MKKVIISHRFYAAPSPINGMGLFANELLPEKEPLFIAFARRGSIEGLESRMKSLKDLGMNNEQFEHHFIELYPTNFCNHSEIPNSHLIWVNDFYIFMESTSEIKPGQEITLDYRKGIQIILSHGFKVNNWTWFLS